MDNINNKNAASYFKIGLFVLIGCSLIVAMLLFFGSSRLWQPLVHIETYFNESIQGVVDGDPIRYRGLQIGYIDKISFTSEIYRTEELLHEQDQLRSIYIKIALTSKLFTRLSKEKLQQFLQREVEQGLRIKLVPQGLTGTSRLELDYFNPQEYPVYPLVQQPHNFYIPAVLSTLSKISADAQDILHELKEVDFIKLFSDLQRLITNLDTVTNRIDNLLDIINEPLSRAIKNINIVTHNLRLITERLRLKPSDILFSSYPPPLDPRKL
jgi:paraquat-inducible protein B